MLGRVLQAFCSGQVDQHGELIPAEKVLAKSKIALNNGILVRRCVEYNL
jgi:hypothetical protein